MTTKSVDLAHLRSVVLAGHAGSGKTTLAESLLFRAGAIPRLGKVDDGTSTLDYEPEEQKRRESLSLAVATFDDDGTIVTLVDTPGYPDFVAETVSAVAACDGALFVVDASGRRRSRPRDGCRAGPLDGHRRRVLHQQGGPRERRPDGDPRRAAGHVRQQDRPAPPGDRRRRVVQRLRRPGASQGLAMGRQDRGRDPDSGRADGRGRSPPGPAPRGGSRGRRRRPDQVPRRGRDHRSGARGLPAQGGQGVDPRPGPGRQRAQGDRPAGAARRVHPLPAVPRRRAGQIRPASRSPAT